MNMEGETRTVDVHTYPASKLGEAGTVIETVRGSATGSEEMHEKRIYKSMLLLALITILLTSFLITGFIYREFYIQMQRKSEMKLFYLNWL